MTLHQMASELGLENLTPELTLPVGAITGGYASDLLSDVLANAPHGGVLVTVQVHMNVIAVALHAGLAAVVLVHEVAEVVVILNGLRAARRTKA